MRHPNSTRAAGIRLRIPTTSAWGYGLLKLMACLKPWRRHTYRYVCEQAAIDRWLGAVRQVATHDATLACRIAELAVLVRGYGRVRAAGLALLEQITLGFDERLRSDRDGLGREVERLLWRARHDPEGEHRTGT